MRYWHEVDFNWGRDAGAYYTADAVFEGEGFAYNGRAEIEQFYAYRRDRGPRVVLHAVTNFSCTFASDTRADAAWVCMLYAHDGEAPQPSARRSTSRSCATSTYTTTASGWSSAAAWSTLFQGGAPVTKLSREAMEQRLAGHNAGKAS